MENIQWNTELMKQETETLRQEVLRSYRKLIFLKQEAEELRIKFWKDKLSKLKGRKNATSR